MYFPQFNFFRFKRKRAHGQIKSTEEGFTLALIAIMLVVFALIAVSIQQKSQRDQFWQPKKEVQNQLQMISTALVAYQRKEGRLPCAASIRTPRGTAGFGEEVDCTIAADGVNTWDFDATGSGDWVRIGLLPVRTLKLNDTHSADAYNHRLLYAVTETLTTDLNDEGVISVEDETGSPVVDNAAFVVVSHGKDGKGAYTAFKGTLVKSCNASDGLDYENCNKTATFLTSAMEQGIGADYYDDLLVWRRVLTTSGTP